LHFGFIKANAYFKAQKIFAAATILPSVLFDPFQILFGKDI